MQKSQEYEYWVNKVLSQPVQSIQPLAGDASARSFHRVQVANQSYVLMDSSGDDSFQQYIYLNKKFASIGINVPEILASEQNRRWILQTDFGDQLLWHALQDSKEITTLYQQALTVLRQLQKQPKIGNWQLPEMSFNFLRNQLNLFEHWFLSKHLNTVLSPSMRRKFTACLLAVVEEIQKIPKRLVHLDFHSRNLLVLPEQRLGVIDFQDASIGPVTYDLVSLFQDAYIEWPRSQVETWLVSYYEELLANHVIPEITFNTFLLWFDYTGLQRHIKNLGIFARLYYRDNKQSYLQYIPRLLSYISTTCARYPEQLGSLENLFKLQLMPKLASKQFGVSLCS